MPKKIGFSSKVLTQPASRSRFEAFSFARLLHEVLHEGHHIRRGRVAVESSTFKPVRFPPLAIDQAHLRELGHAVKEGRLRQFQAGSGKAVNSPESSYGCAVHGISGSQRGLLLADGRVAAGRLHIEFSRSP